MARFSVPGTSVARPLPQGQQGLAVLTLSDGFLNYFSRHDASRVSLTYWPFHRRHGILQMGINDSRTNYTGLLPGLGEWLTISDVAPDGAAAPETESSLLNQQITPWLIENKHQAGVGTRVTRILAVPGMQGVLIDATLDASRPALRLSITPPTGQGAFELIDPAKDPGRFMGFKGRETGCQVSVGQPMLRREGRQILAGFEKPIDDTHDPRATLTVLRGEIIHCEPVLPAAFNQPQTIDLAPDADGRVTFAWIFADNAADADVFLSMAEGKSFEEHLADTEAHWKRFADGCTHRIEQKMSVDLTRLSQVERRILEWNLIYLKQMQLGTGTWTASITNYWFSYSRDDGVCGEFADRLGLAEVFNRDLVRGFLRNPMTSDAWGIFWDTWYNNNYRDAEGEIESQSDSEFFAVRTVYNYWKSTGSREFLTPRTFETIRGAVDYLEKRYFDAELGLFKADRVNEGSVRQDNEVRAPSGAKVLWSVDVCYAGQGYACLLMLAEMADALGMVPIANAYRQKATTMRPRLRDLVTKPDGTLRWGKLRTESGYEEVDCGWMAPMPDGTTKYSSNRFEVAFTWGLTLLPNEEMRVFNAEQRRRTLEAFDKNRQHRKTFDEILLACTPSLRAAKVGPFMRQACESRPIWSGFYGDMYKDCVHLCPYGIPELIDQGRKPQAFTITPVLYHLAEYYRHAGVPALVD